MWEYLNLRSHSNQPNVCTKYRLLETWHPNPGFEGRKTYLGLKTIRPSRVVMCFPWDSGSCPHTPPPTTSWHEDHSPNEQSVRRDTGWQITRVRDHSLPSTKHNAEARSPFDQPLPNRLLDLLALWCSWLPCGFSSAYTRCTQPCGVEGNAHSSGQGCNSIQSSCGDHHGLYN